MDRTLETTTRFSLHAAILERGSNSVKNNRNPVLTRSVQPFEHMGDARHKNAPNGDDLDLVTEEFRRDARFRIEAHKAYNRASGLKPGDPGWKIDNYAKLAEAVGTDTTQITNILGPVRSTSKPKRDGKLVGRSVFVRKIREALGLTPTRALSVPLDLVPLVERWSEVREGDRRLILEAITSVLRQQRR